MKVCKKNVPVYHERNAPFNKAIEVLAQDIFQHHTVGAKGYITARVAGTMPYPTKLTIIEHVADDTESKSKLERFDLLGLGEYEKRVFSSLATGKYHTIVLVGEMGSGKSATITHLVEVLQRPRSSTCGVCEHCAPVIIKMNFNAGFQDPDPDIVLRTFRWHLYQDLRFELRHLFSNSKLTDQLLEEVKNPTTGKDFAAFDRFEQEYGDMVQWSKKTTEDKANSLFSYVDECTKNGAENIIVMMKLVYLAKQKLRSDPACLVLIFDNIDSILPEAQYKILNEILQYQEIAQVQSLVTLRRSNFFRFEENSAAHAFGTINHIGPDIKEVVRQRLDHYIENWGSLPEVNQLDHPEYRDALRNRLVYLRTTADEERSALQRVASICGSSIRQGLFMCERFLMNTTVAFDGNPRYKDDIVRAVLVEKGSTNEISPEDLCIANLLLNIDTGEASLLNLRILQLVAELEKAPSNRLSKLADMLKAIGYDDKGEIISALNYLLYMRRPLLWVDGKTKYTKDTFERHDDDVLHLTESGYFYLRELMFDLVYVQEAALSVGWPEGKIPRTVDYSLAVERFQVLRRCLEELEEQDYEQSKDFKKNWLKSRRGGGFSIKPILLLNRVMASVGRSALNILLHQINDKAKPIDDQRKHEMIGELKNWQSTITKWIFEERKITKGASGAEGEASKRLERLAEDYNVMLIPHA